MPTPESAGRLVGMEGRSTRFWVATAATACRRGACMLGFLPNGARKKMEHTHYPTIIHERVDLARKGQNPTVICRLRSGWLVLGDDQRLRGYSLLLADPIRDNLNELDPPERKQFLMDMASVGDALLRVQSPSLINYSILGNTDRALHAHIHPRYDSEAPEHRRTVPIIYHILKMPPVPFDAVRDAGLMAQIRKTLSTITDVIG